jgi:hypothetical protein
MRSARFGDGLNLAETSNRELRCSYALYGSGIDEKPIGNTVGSICDGKEI